MITVWDAFAVIGIMASVVFVYMVYVISKQHYSEAERFDVNQVQEELPKWEKMNVVARMAKKELDKQYKERLK